MRIESEVGFDEVKAAFLRENADTRERNDWPIGALDVANRQFGKWTRIILLPEEVLTVMLPCHAHGVDLVPAIGSSVLEAVKKLDFVSRSSECYKRILRFSDARTPDVFLSAAPISDVRYSDYRGLLSRGHRGLTHLDGLHRLIAWGLEKRREVPAYVAGIPAIL